MRRCFDRGAVVVVGGNQAGLAIVYFLASSPGTDAEPQSRGPQGPGGWESLGQCAPVRDNSFRAQRSLRTPTTTPGETRSSTTGSMIVRSRYGTWLLRRTTLASGRCSTGAARSCTTAPLPGPGVFVSSDCLGGKPGRQSFRISMPAEERLRAVDVGCRRRHTHCAQTRRSLPSLLRRVR
jgi:hypothetical protein